MQPTKPNTRTRATLLAGLAAGTTLALAGGQALAGEVVMSGTIDGDERTWERFDTDDGGPAFFTDLPAGARLFNLHGLRDGSTPNPLGSLIVSVTTFNDNVGRVVSNSTSTERVRDGSVSSLSGFSRWCSSPETRPLMRAVSPSTSRRSNSYSTFSSWSLPTKSGPPACS